MGNPGLNTSHVQRALDKRLPSAQEQRAQRLASGHIVIVCGGRGYQDSERVFAALDVAHARKPITLIVHGACMDRRTGMLLGADRWATEWARSRGVPTEPHPVDWATWGSTADDMRDKQMAGQGAHGCIAFPGGRGTSSMIAQAEACGIPVWRPFSA